MHRKREHQIRSRGRRRPSNRRRRELLVIFALIFGALGTRGVVHARPVPFAIPPPISTSAGFAVSVYAADVDGDGDVDTLSASRSDDKIAWYENAVGDGTSWVLHTISTSADDARSVYAADVDGDGDLDALSASNADDKIAWYENVGGGGTSWALHTISTSAASAFVVYAADVDGDGDLDALSASYADDKIAWYENAGGGGTTWVLHTISTSANAPYSVHAADVDGDGDLDALSASYDDDKVAWYENMGGGGTSWVLHTISTSANGPFIVSAADVDGDGDLDALSESGYDGKLAWYENVGGGGTSWALHTISTSANATSFYVTDADSDGDLDVLLASNYGNTIAWFENVGGGGTSWVLHTISDSANAAVYAADVDGDGDLDALSANVDNTIAWYRNDSIHRGITFVSHPEISTSASGPNSVYAADVDGDGDLDGLSASFYDDKIAWYENVGGGGTSWALRTISTSADGAFSVYVADVDGDGDLDALSASQEDDKIAWYENVGGGGTSWALHTISTTADRAISVYSADVDGDGDLDALSASFNDDKIAWYENVGGGGTSWVLRTISTSAVNAGSVYAADVDGDGDLDALSASASFYSQKIAWYENVGGGGTSWALHTISTSADVSLSVYAADVDGDGDLDALSASMNDDKIAWYENVGGGGTSWVPHTIATSADWARSVYAADVDRDGDLDALSASFVDNKIAWYENAGGGGTSWVLHTIATDANFASSVYAADVDGDGDLDVLSASRDDSTIAWYENRVGGMDFHTVAPCRLLDTRVLGQGPALTSGNRELVVPPNCGIPGDALAVALNVTVVSPTVGGHVTVFPGATAAPGTSTINFSAGQTRANNQVVGLAPDFSGKLILRAVVPGGEVHFLVDVVGYF
jgi:hypothetical protein